MARRSSYDAILAGEAGAWATPIRGALRIAESIYALGVRLRNRWYDRLGPRVVLPVPVISIGNLTVGGTGKTPFVIAVVRMLDEMGRSPAVVSRGYKAVDDRPNDEERVIRANCPGVVCVSDPDRARAGEIARSRFGADVIVLDDGFQHRGIGRSLDIVLIDATCPFGYEHLLPRGLLREPLRGLARADVVVITRHDQVSPAELARIDRRLRKIAGDATHLRCGHAFTGMERLDGTPVEESPDGKRAILFAGIGRPRAFATTVRSLGVEVVGERWWPDHHHFRLRDIESLLKPGRFPEHDFLLTTEKDAAKLIELGGIDHGRILVVKVAIDFEGDDGRILRGALQDLLKKS